MCFGTFADQIAVSWQLRTLETCEDHVESLNQRCWPFGRCSGHGWSGADAVFGSLSLALKQFIRRTPNTSHAKSSLARRSLFTTTQNCSYSLFTYYELLERGLTIFSIWVTGHSIWRGLQGISVRQSSRPSLSGDSASDFTQLHAYKASSSQHQPSSTTRRTRFTSTAQRER
jgi:hypothetical protein